MRVVMVDLLCLERVQSGLMTVVGMGVMAYLTTLDNMGGGGS